MGGVASERPCAAQRETRPNQRTAGHAHTGSIPSASTKFPDDFCSFPLDRDVIVTCGPAVSISLPRPSDRTRSRSTLRGRFIIGVRPKRHCRSEGEISSSSARVYARRARRGRERCRFPRSKSSRQRTRSRSASQSKSCSGCQPEAMRRASTHCRRKSESRDPKSRMREIRTSGSVGGRGGNPSPAYPTRVRRTHLQTR